MADSRRELVLKAVKTALEQASVTVNSSELTKPTGLVVHRHFTRHAQDSDLPDITVFVAGENTQKADDDKRPVNLNTRSLIVRTRCRVKTAAGISGDEALDPILTWAEVALMSDYTLGGVAAEIDAPDMDAMSAREYAESWAEATLQFEIRYETKWADVRQAP